MEFPNKTLNRRHERGDTRNVARIPQNLARQYDNAMRGMNEKMVKHFSLIPPTVGLFQF